MSRPAVGSRVEARRGGWRWVGVLEHAGDHGVCVRTDAGEAAWLAWQAGPHALTLHALPTESETEPAYPQEDRPR